MTDRSRGRYSTLVERHQGTLFRYALGMVADTAVARELVEQAFVDAFEAVQSGESLPRFDLRSLAILRRRCLRHLTSRGGEGSSRTPGSSPAGPLQEALNILPDPEEREAFLLRHVERLSYRDMSIVVGADQSEMKARVHRARERLV